MPDYGRGKRPLDKPTRQEARMRANRDAAYTALDKFGDVPLRTLIERGERVVKGSVEGDKAAGAKGAVSEPTARVALEGLPNDDETPDVWRERHDLVGKIIDEVAGLLDLAAVTAQAAQDKLQFVLNLSADEFEVIGRHKTAAPCRACATIVTGSADDRLRSGYCNACRAAWDRRMASWNQPGAPDRVAFERDRLRKADEERRMAS